jgi:hypothetical protein
MSNRKDYTGQKFGKLTVLEMIYEKGQRSKARCLCDCGNECIKICTNIVSMYTKSCGCINNEPRLYGIKDFTGSIFGNLLLLKRIPEFRKPTKYICVCSCGNFCTKYSRDITIGNVKSCGCLHIPIVLDNYIGKRFGKLCILNVTIEEEFICKCDCGKEIIKPFKNIIYKNTKSCGCINRSDRSNHFNWRGFGEISLDYFNSIKVGAKRRNLEFDMTIEFLWNLYLQQDRCCNLSGIEIYFPKKENGFVQTASLDRINSKIGYLKSNVQWVHKDINKMKNIFDEDYFKELCIKVALKTGKVKKL